MIWKFQYWHRKNGLVNKIKMLHQDERRSRRIELFLHSWWCNICQSKSFGKLRQQDLI